MMLDFLSNIYGEGEILPCNYVSFISGYCNVIGSVISCVAMSFGKRKMPKSE